jgi:hypothetical protein
MVRARRRIEARSGVRRFRDETMEVRIRDPRTWGEFVLSHPSGKNKDAARMGHPEFLCVFSVQRIDGQAT